MPNLPIQKLRYQLRYRYPTRQIASIVAVVAIVLWFIWGSVVAMQKNYSLRANVAAKKRERSLVKVTLAKRWWFCPPTAHRPAPRIHQQNALLPHRLRQSQAILASG